MADRRAVMAVLADHEERAQNTDGDWICVCGAFLCPSGDERLNRAHREHVATVLTRTPSASPANVAEVLGANPTATALCRSCGEPAIHLITLNSVPTPVCLRHLNHWRTPPDTALRERAKVLADLWERESAFPGGHSLLVQVYGQHAADLRAALDQSPTTRRTP